MNRILKTFLLLFLSISVFAQGICDKPGIEKGGFTFDGPSAVCIGQEIKIKDNSGGTDVKYIYGYQGQDASQLPTISSTTTTKWAFLAEGKYVILQYGKKNGRDMYFCNVATILKNTEPVFTNSACNDFLAINIPVDPANAFDYYQIDWGDGAIDNIPAGTALPINRSRNYPTHADSRDIKVEGFYNTPTSCPRATFKNVLMNGGGNYPRITTLELSPDNQSAIITFTGAADIYDIYQRSATGNYVNGQFAMQAKPGTYTINLVDKNQSCFKLYRNYGCKEGSGEVCTTKLDVEAVDKTNVLKWQNHPSGGTTITYDVQVVVTGVTSTIKKEEKGAATTIINTPGNPHIDPIDCSKEYCYQIENKVNGTIDYGRFTYESVSLSPKRCISRKDVKPDAITASLVSVKDDNHVDITITDNSPWTLQRQKYLIYRVENNIDLKEISSSINKQFVDNTIDASEDSYCYKIAFVDECGSTSSVSPALCTINLSEATGNNLEWTNESPFGSIPISTFEVQSYNEQTNVASTEVTKNATLTTYVPQIEKFEEEAKYRIKAISSDGKESYSNVYIIPLSIKLFLPEAFSPNDDSINDKLEIKGSLKRITDFEIQIYNRWGNPVFVTTNPLETWNGMIQEKMAPVDTYSYKIYAKLKDGQKVNKTGKFVLLR